MDLLYYMTKFAAANTDIFKRRSQWTFVRAMIAIDCRTPVSGTCTDQFMRVRVLVWP
jgi:hypothetical protein